MSMPTRRISCVQLVLVGSTDQDRSTAFYEALGFERRNDIPWGGRYRWVEVYPPDGKAGIALIPPAQPQLAGDPRIQTGIQTGILFNTDDIDETHTHVQSLGVDVDKEIAGPGSPAQIRLGAVEMAGHMPPMFWFRDSDGNSPLMVEAK